VNLYGFVNDALDRLGDLDNDIWTRSEMELYAKDGYDTFCRRTKALFDTFVIENLPRVGNWQTDLEKYLAEQKPGWALTDEPFHMTAEHERNLGTGGKIGGTYRGPSAVTAPSNRKFVGVTGGAGEDIPATVPGGLLPQSTVEVIRVAYDKRDLQGISSQQMRVLDPNYETRSGDPQWYIHDKDGLYYLRVVPAAQGDAVYDTVDGYAGTMTQTDDSTVDIVTTEVNGYNTGGYGILRHRTGWFAAGGPFGSPTRIHPDDINIKVEVYRLGRDLKSHPSELPSAYDKYVTYWAMSKALRRSGPGQDIELSDHYAQRFEMGISRMTAKKNKMQPERVGRFGGVAQVEPFGLGMPQPPYPYGSTS